MTDPRPPEAAGSRRPPRRRISPFRLYLLFVGLLVLLVVVLGVVLAVQAKKADDRLHDARSAVARLRADLVKPDVPQSTIDADAVAVAGPAKAATDITHGTLWSLAGHVPFLDHAIASARGTSDAVRDVATEVLPDLTQAQSQLRSDNLESDGGIQLAPLRTAQPLLERASTQLQGILQREQALRAHTVVGSVDGARTDLISQLTSLTGQLRDASDAARVLPTMIGGSGTRYYFLGFESESEARGLGGLPGAFAILKAEDGKLSLDQLEPDTYLNGVTATGVTGLDAGFVKQFTTGPLQKYVNSDVSANFPDAAKIWMGMWKAKTGQTLDGALVVDPTALGALLDVVGPAKLANGQQVTGENVVDLTERQAYVEFGSDDTARKQFLIGVAKAAADKLIAAGPKHATQLAHTAAREIGERRLLVYSAHADEESVLAAQPSGGLVPPVSGPDAVTGPYLQVALNNGAGSKVDYWLDRTVDWQASGCTTGERTSTVTIELTNDAPAGLPESVTGPGFSDDGLPLDTSRQTVMLYTTAGAGLLNATVDGKQVQTSSDTSQGRPVYGLGVVIPRGKTVTVVVRLLEPSGKGPATLETQPLVRPQTSKVDVPAC